MFVRMGIEPDSELTASITDDVMRCLRQAGFFEKLDDLLCPTEVSLPRESCTQGYNLSRRVLLESGFETSDLSDVFEVLKSRGGFCDCEILYNVGESSRLKADHWRSRAQHLRSHAKESND